jgi:hypothetical protein
MKPIFLVLASHCENKKSKMQQKTVFCFIFLTSSAIYGRSPWILPGREKIHFQQLKTSTYCRFTIKLLGLLKVLCCKNQIYGALNFCVPFKIPKKKGRKVC